TNTLTTVAILLLLCGQGQRSSDQCQWCVTGECRLQPGHTGVARVWQHCQPVDQTARPGLSLHRQPGRRVQQQPDEDLSHQGQQERWFVQAGSRPGPLRSSLPFSSLDFGIVLGCKIYVKEVTNRNLSNEKDASLQEGDIIHK